MRCAGGSRLSRPLLAAHHHLTTNTYIFYTSTRPFPTMARAPSPRKHPRSDDALVVVRCAGRVALVATVTRRPPPSTHYHLHLLHFYTAIFHDGEGAPLLRPLARLTSFGGYVATGGGRDKRDPPAVRPKTYQLPSTNYPLHKCNRKSKLPTAIYQLPTT